MASSLQTLTVISDVDTDQLFTAESNPTHQTVHTLAQLKPIPKHGLVYLAYRGTSDTYQSDMITHENLQ